ncbi:MAG: cysteine desulfurase family protein [Christensenellales bacterium]
MFFDNASTTKVDENIMNELLKINDEYFYNPGGLYLGGRKSKNFVDNCKKEILSKLGAYEDYNLIFTGSATEANNLALLGFVKKNTRKILVSVGEHPSVYNTALELKQRGFNVEFIKLDKTGKVDVGDFKSKMSTDVDLVSIMHVSNETGAINDISYLVEYSKSINPRVVFHTDGVQACGKISVDLSDLGVDMYTISAHKIHGFKGVGALFVKKGIFLKPIIFGGGQENGLRSGTENLLGIFSLYKAIEIAVKDRELNFNHTLNLKNKFLELLSKTNLKYSVHSDDNCSPYIVSISFIGCRAETILHLLSDRDIFVGNGSACSSKNSGNRILENMGVDKKGIESNLRISFSKFNTIQEIEEFVANLNEVVLGYLKKVK